MAKQISAGGNAISNGLEEVRIKRIGVISFAGITAVISAIFGLVMGIIVSLLTMLIGASIPGSQGLGTFEFVFGFGSLIIFPLAFFIVTFIANLIFALIFNLAAKIIGGLKIYA